MKDVRKLFRLERYMREEGFTHTSSAARDRLVELGELPTAEEEEELQRAEDEEERATRADMQSWLESMKQKQRQGDTDKGIGVARGEQEHGTKSTEARRQTPVRQMREAPCEGQPAAAGASADQTRQWHGSGSQGRGAESSRTKERKRKPGDVRSGAEY